jgi:hypothetical protein
MNARMVLAAATLMLACLSTPGHAQVTDPRFCQMDPVIVGGSSGNPIQTVQQPPIPPHAAGFLAIARDVNLAPVANALCTLNFGISGMTVHTTQSGGTTYNCAAHTLSRFTDSFGMAFFYPQIGKFNNGNSIDVSFNGIVIGSAKGRSTDINGDGQTAIVDLGTFSPLYLDGLNGHYHPEIDYNADGQISIADQSIFTAEFLSGAVHGVCP